jgi:hypothetical protein
VRRMVAAAVAAREDAAARAVEEATARAEDAEGKAAAAERRAATAERAKIELTMALADAADARARDVDTYASSSPAPPISVAAPSTVSYDHLDDAAQMESLLRRADEAELAAAVQTRRAATAEGELHAARAQLADAQRQVKELAWQVQMTLGPTTIGGVGDGAAAQAAGSTGWSISDMMRFNACGANFVRKRDSTT